MSGCLGVWRATSVTSSLLNSGMLGLGIGLLWYTKFSDNLYFLVGICLMAGLGGMTTVEFFLAFIRKGGFNITIGDNSFKVPEPGEDKKDVK